MFLAIHGSTEKSRLSTSRFAAEGSDAYNGSIDYIELRTVRGKSRLSDNDGEFLGQLIHIAGCAATILAYNGTSVEIPTHVTLHPGAIFACLFIYYFLEKSSCRSDIWLVHSKIGSNSLILG